MQQNADTPEGKAKILEQFPTFSNWRESWEHNYHKCAMAAKDGVEHFGIIETLFFR